MTWLTWRQFRPQAFVALAAMAAYAVLLAATGPHLAALFAARGLDGCRSGCTHAATLFALSLNRNGYTVLFGFAAGLNLLTPLLTGLFWGAPLIGRELETGTAALAWNQSVTRTRWLAVKLAVGGLAAMAVAEALALLLDWWAAPISQATADGGDFTIAPSRFSELNFITHGTAPLGYAAFAFALGVTVGLLVRRAVPAMALTLVLFALLQVAVPFWVRPHLFAPDHALTAISSFEEVDVAVANGTFTLVATGWDSQHEGWTLSSGAANTGGQPVSAIPAACTQVANTPGKADHTALLDCLGSHGIRVAVTYQPAGRYWKFQWTETAIYIALALALAGYCLWRLNRRLT